MAGIFVFDASDGSKRRNVLSRTCVDVDGKNVKKGTTVVDEPMEVDASTEAKTVDVKA